MKGRKIVKLSEVTLKLSVHVTRNKRVSDAE